jgi:membrane fusion protein, multidrug efflux system
MDASLENPTLTRRAGGIALLAVLLPTLLAGCGAPTAQTAAEPTPVRVQAAVTGPARPPISTNGVVATKDEMRLSFKAGGVIESIRVHEGDAIRRGDKLAEIELTEVNSQVEQVRQLAGKAQRDLGRGERLYADQVISLEQLQDLRTQDALARAQLRSAEFNRGYAAITAPRDGVVLRKMAADREVVPAGQPILTIGARDDGYVVKASLSDRDVVQLKLGDPAEIRMDAYPNETIAGTVSEIAGAADGRSGLFPVEVRFDSTPVRLADGLVAKLKLHPAAARVSRLTYVPIAAIVEGDGDRASVFVVRGDRVRRRPVHVAFIAPQSVALADGLEPGERVVTDGALYLQDEERIEVVGETTRVVGAPGPSAG